MKMKRLVAAILSASALAAAADTVTGSNEIGTLAITSTLKNTVVAVPFKTLGGSVDAVKPQELVLTANLTEGDQLYIFQGGAYKGYVLGSSGWEGVDNASIGSDGLPTCTAATDSTTVATGSGFWLVRKDVPAEPFTFYIYGEYKADVASSITAGAQNLIANPLAVPANPEFSLTPANGDAILFPQAGVLPKRYTYKNSVWNCDLETGLPAFAAGQGAWYISKGASDMTCTWEAE